MRPGRKAHLTWARKIGICGVGVPLSCSASPPPFSNSQRSTVCLRSTGSVTSPGRWQRQGSPALIRTNSAAISETRSGLPSAQRYLIARLRPSTQASSRSRFTKAATRWLMLIETDAGAEAGRQGAHTQPRGYRSPCHWPAGSPSITSRDGLPSWYGLDREDRMKKKLGLSLLAALATAALGVTTSVQAQQASMTFFVASVGKG